MALDVTTLSVTGISQSPQLLLPQNDHRTYILIQNLSEDNGLILTFGSDGANISAPGILIEAGGAFETPASGITTQMYAKSTSETVDITLVTDHEDEFVTPVATPTPTDTPTMTWDGAAYFTPKTIETSNPDPV